MARPAKIIDRPTQSGHSWPAAIAGAILLLGGAVAASSGAWSDIYHIATADEEASHILLVPFVAAALIWVRKDQLRDIDPAPSAVGPILIAIGWAASHFGFHHAIQSFWHGGALLIAVGAILTFLGHRVLFQLLPVALLLLFLIPVPGMVRQRLALPLQTMSARTTEFLLHAGGVAVSRSGNMLSINNIDVTIAEACNGLRMVFGLFLVSYAVCFCMNLSTPLRILILLLSPVTAILCNVVRLVPTVYLFGHGSESLADKFHDAAGWVMLPFATLLLIGLASMLRRLSVFHPAV